MALLRLGYKKTASSILVLVLVFQGLLALEEARAVSGAQPYEEAVWQGNGTSCQQPRETDWKQILQPLLMTAFPANILTAILRQTLSQNQEAASRFLTLTNCVR